MSAFTPRTRPPSRKSRLTLSARQYSKIAHTIDSVRQRRAPNERNVIEEIDDEYRDEPSFVEERSFINAPLNSRLGPIPHATPKNKSKGKGKESVKDDLGLLEIEVQEAMILEDLLNVLTGIEGICITFDEDYNPDEADEEMLLKGPKLVLDSTLDPSLRDVVEQVLPLATYYMAVRAFTELRSSLEFGLVNHALCAALRDMLKDYSTLISQLEHAFNSTPGFSLQQLWFYVHPTLHKLGLLYKVVQALSPSQDSPEGSSVDENDGADSDANDSDENTDSSDDEAAKKRREALGLAPLPPSLRNGGAVNGTKPTTTPYTELPIIGGEVLTILSTLMKLHSGDRDAARVFGLLWRKSCVPYVKMLKMWMERGLWKDRWDEGCVREAKWSGNATGDDEWERRYTLRDGSSLSSSKVDRMSSALPHQGPVGVPAPRPYLTPPQINSTEKRLPGGACIPPELEPYKRKILLAGKYLNVIRECGVEIVDDGDGEAKILAELGGEVDLTSESWRKQIEKAYTYANVTLLALLIGTNKPARDIESLTTAPLVLLEDQPQPTRSPTPQAMLGPLATAPSGGFTPLSPKVQAGHRENTLLSRLRSLRHFFFLAQGSYLPHFLDLASVEMRKSTKSVGHTRLQPLLDIALAAEGAPYREDVQVLVGNTGPLYDWLLKIVSVQGVRGEEQLEEEEREKREREKEKEKDDGKKEKEKGTLAIDALCLDYAVPFPLSLVISRSTLMRYQIIFRFLLHLKHIERVLSSMWLDQKLPVWRKPIPSHPDLAKWRNKVFLLRARMVALVQQVLSFATLDCLEPNWKKFEDRLRSIKTVDELLRDHVDFLDTCLKGCMLTNSKLLKAYSKLIVTCSTFALYSNQFTTSAQQAMTQLEEAGGDASAVPMAKRWEFLTKFQVHFDHWFTSFADIIQFYASSENVALLPLVTRLAHVQLLDRGSDGPSLSPVA